MVICNIQELETIGKVQFFKCGSLKLAKFLYQKEIVPVGSFVSKKTGKLIYTYVKSAELDEALTEWHDNKDGEKDEKR